MKKIITALSILSLIACAGGKKEPGKSNIEEKEVEKELIELTIDAIGESMAEMAFEPTNITIKANSRVKLVLNNKSSSAGMLHNLVLVELGSGQDIATAGIKAGKSKQFVPKDKRVIAYTIVCVMGESTTIEFDAPPKGSYHYICTYPGHYPMMTGRLNVE